jgi:uncharacterized protein (DUF1810 family)
LVDSKLGGRTDRWTVELLDSYFDGCTDKWTVALVDSWMDIQTGGQLIW